MDEFEAEVHLQIRVVGKFHNRLAEQFQIAFNFISVPDDFLRVAVVEQFRRADGGLHSPCPAKLDEARKNLLVNPAVIINARRVAEQSRDAMPAVRFLAFVHQRQAEGNHLRALHVGAQPLMLGGWQFLVGVEHQNPVAGGVFQRGVARGGKIVAPGERINFRAE